ncbi:MAG: type II toxin-antitoxin system VapC family toxin [Chloroflexi bacterium]|nr:type II toxin-antitoxin system VapC family toxin [Chloroflexota bacterium]
MIAVDTNVLIRYITQDVPAQAAIAERLLDSLTNDGPGFVGREVAIEIVWVLERSYGFSRTQVAEVLTTLIGAENLIVESDEDVARATFLYEQSQGDFSDLVILMASERAGCESLYTFDRRFARMDGVRLLHDDFPSAT